VGCSGLKLSPPRPWCAACDPFQHSQVLLPTPNPRSSKICVVLVWIVASVGASISSTAQGRARTPWSSSGTRVSRFSGVVRHADGTIVAPGAHILFWCTLNSMTSVGDGLLCLGAMPRPYSSSAVREALRPDVEHELSTVTQSQLLSDICTVRLNGF